MAARAAAGACAVGRAPLLASRPVGRPRAPIAAPLGAPRRPTDFGARRAPLVSDSLSLRPSAPISIPSERESFSKRHKRIESMHVGSPVSTIDYNSGAPPPRRILHAVQSNATATCTPTAKFAGGPQRARSPRPHALRLTPRATRAATPSLALPADIDIPLKQPSPSFSDSSRGDRSPQRNGSVGLSRKNRPQRCSICKECGHKSRTCRFAQGNKGARPARPAPPRACTPAWPHGPCLSVVPRRLTVCIALPCLPPVRSGSAAGLAARLRLHLPADGLLLKGRAQRLLTRGEGERARGTRRLWRETASCILAYYWGAHNAGLAATALYK